MITFAYHLISIIYLSLAPNRGILCGLSRMSQVTVS